MIHNKYNKVLREFLRGYDREIYGRELDGKIGLSQKNIALTLDEMEKQGILRSKTKGNTRFYSLNTNNSLLWRYLILAEVNKSIDFFNKHLKIKHIFENFSCSGIVFIFGSYAKGKEKKDSDLDILIVGKIDEKELEKKAKAHGIDISVKKTSKANFVKEIRKDSELMREVLENHVIIYGYEDFVKEVIKSRW